MTIEKRNGKYYCRFQIDGERKHLLCRGAKDEKEARKMENAFMFKLQQQQNGVLPKENNKKKKKKKLSDLYKEFKNFSKLNKKSWQADFYRLKNIMEIWNDNTCIEDIKPNDIEILKNKLLKKGMSTTTVNRHLEIISKMFNIAIANEWTDKNPVKKGTKFREKNYQIRYLTKEEEARLIECSSQEFKDFIFVDLCTGLRAANLRNLQGRNIKLDYGIIELTENKGNKHIKLPICNKLYSFLKEHPLKDDEYLFINPRTGKPYSESAFGEEWNRIKKKAGITNLRFHDLRHTVGTRLAEKRVPINVIKEIMAHSDIGTTMRYIHYADEQLIDAVNLL